jgi:hypothetical protein
MTVRREIAMRIKRGSFTIPLTFKPRVHICL